MNNWTDGFRRGDHAIHVYQTDSERDKAVLDLIAWRRNDEKLICLSDKWSRSFKADDGFPAIGHLKSDIKDGRIELRSSYSSYCPGGNFRGPGMYRLWEKAYDDAIDQGYNGLVAVGDTSWLGVHKSILPSFMRYEQGIDFARLPRDLTILCQYDRRLFTSEQIGLAEQVHQLRLSAGRLDRNHWFILRRTAGTDFSPESLKRPSVISESFMK
jgi:hypothetical protein